MRYLSTTQVGEKWNCFPRWVAELCGGGRIKGAQKAGSTWIIPEDADRCPLISCWAGIPRRIPVQIGFSPLIRKHCRLFMKHRCMYGTRVGLL